MIPQLKRTDNAQSPVPVSESQALSTEIREALLHQNATPTFADFLEIVLRRKGLIIGVFVLCLLAAMAINVMTKPVFKAVGYVELNPDGPKVTKFENVLNNPNKTDEYYATQAELLKSSALARRVIEKLDLEHQPGFNDSVDRANEKRIIWKLANNLMDFKATVMGMIMRPFQPATEHVEATGEAKRQLMRQQGMEDTFKERLTVEGKPDTSIFEISFDSTDPALAAAVVNGLIEEYINWQMDRRIEAARTAKQQLEKQISLARKEMEKSETAIAQYSKEKGIVSLDSRLNLVYQQLEKINTALAEAEAERIKKAEFYQYTAGSDISSSPLVMENKLIQTLRQQYIELMGEYEKLRVFFKDDYPSVKNLKAKMLDVGKRIDVEQQRILASFKNDYEAASKREKALLATAEEKKNAALQLNEYANRYKVLEREVEINKQIFQSLLERSKEIDANVGTDLGNIRIVDLASIPFKPVKPKMLRNVLLACVLGLIGGFGLAFFREYADRTVRRIDEISDVHMIPILGVLPLADKEDTKKRDLMYGSKLDRLVSTSPSSLFSEAVRAARASVEMASRRQNSGMPNKVMLITGTTSGEGKTVIAANLAQAYASAGMKTLIVDADLRRPRPGTVFSMGGTNGAHGLSHFLNGACDVEQIIHETDIANLYFVPSGPASSRLAEMLGSAKMKTLLHTFSENFDRVILDSPPFGVFADVMLLAGQVDAVVLMTALGKTHREDVRIFRRKMREAGANLLGSIVNKLDLNRYNGSYYQKHYRNYYSARTGMDVNLPARVDVD